MDERRELARRLRQMAVTTGDLNCLGCGYERGCSVHGCAVLRRAADLIAPEVDINKPIPLEELRAVATEARTEMNKWVSVQERLPTEHDSIFKKLIHTDRSKWNNDMFLSESDYVIVSVTFRDGTRKTGYAHTKDGMWVGLPMIGGPVVTHWMPMPEPPKGDK